MCSKALPVPRHSPCAPAYRDGAGGGEGVPCFQADRGTRITAGLGEIPSGPSSFLPVLSCGHHQLLQQQIHLGCAAFSLSWGSLCDVQIDPNKSRFLLQLPRGAGTEIPATFCLVNGGIRVPPPQGCQGGAEAPPTPYCRTFYGFTTQCLGWRWHQLRYWDLSPPRGRRRSPHALCWAEALPRGLQPRGFRFSRGARRDDLNNLIPGCDQAWRKGKGNKEAPGPEQQ